MTRRPRPNLPPSIHPIEPVSSQPVSVMTDWRIFQLRGPTNLRSRHLVGRADGEGRVCSALARLDLTTLTAVSGSGRFYRLEGSPGQDPDATYVWEQWTRLNRTTHIRDMTRALLRLGRLRGLQDLWEAAPPAELWGPLE
jgi:hypothetical protein